MRIGPPREMSNTRCDRTGNGREATQPVGSRRKDNVANTGDQSGSSRDVGVSEFVIAEERLYPSPFVCGGDLWSKIASRLPAEGAICGGLRQDALSTDNCTARLTSFRADGGFDVFDALEHHGPECLVRELFESRRAAHRQRYELRHGAIFTEKVLWSASAHRFAVKQAIQRSCSGPMVCALNQSVLDGVREGVCHLREKIFRGGEPDDTCLL